MKIKNIVLRKINDSSNDLQAVASIEFNNGLALHEIAVIKRSDNTFFITMPSEKIFHYADDKEGFFFDIAHPINFEFREELQNSILNFFSNCHSNDIETCSFECNDENMNITEMHFQIPRYPNLPRKLKNEVSITIDNQLCIHGIKIIEHNDKLFVAFPGKKTPSGEYKDIIHPTIAEKREQITKKILEAYQAQNSNKYGHNKYKAAFTSKWIKKNDLDYCEWIDKWFEKITEENYDSEEAELQNNLYGERLAECIEQYLKAIVLYKSSVTIPDEIQEAYEKKYGQRLELSEKEEIAFFTEFADDDFFMRHAVFKNLRDLTGNCFKKLKQTPENEKLLSIFSGRNGHNLAAIINALPMDDQQYLIRDISFNPFFSRKDLPENQNYTTNNTIETKFGTVLTTTTASYPVGSETDAESENRLKEALYRSQRFYILFEELSKPQTSNAFVDGRYYSENFKANFKFLYMLCNATRKLIEDTFENAINIGNRKLIFPDNDTEILIIAKKNNNNGEFIYQNNFEQYGDSSIFYKRIGTNKTTSAMLNDQILFDNADFALIYTENGVERRLHQYSHITQEKFSSTFGISQILFSSKKTLPNQDMEKPEL